MPKVLSIGVCDDNMIECTALSQKIKRLFSLKGIAATVSDFYSGQALLIWEQKIDILFLDIKMASLNGLETAKLLREQGQDFLLIFITSAEEYVYDAFEVEAFRYLLKPADDFKLEQSLFAAVEKKRKNPGNFFIFHRNHEVIKINLDEVFYFEITGRVIKAHLKMGCEEFYGKISTLEESLLDLEFFRCHKSYLVNLKFVESFSKTEIIMENGDRLFLSRRRTEAFSKAFLSYLKKSGGLIDVNPGESM